MSDDWSPFDVGGNFAIAVGPSSAATPKQEVTDFDSVKVRFHLYDGDSVSFTTSGVGAAAPYIDGYASDVWLYRANTVWQRFRMLPAAQEWDEHGADVVSCQAICYKQVLAGRLLHAPVTLYATSADQGAILKSYIDNTQAQAGGHLGITFGSYITAVQRQRTEQVEGDNVYDLADKLSKVINGLTWRIAPGSTGDREYSAAGPSTLWFAVPLAQPAVLGDNVEKLRRVPPGTFANSGFAPGPSGLSNEWYDAPGIATDPRGRWEVSRSPSSGTTTQTNVAETAQGIVDELGAAPAAWVLQLRTSRFLTDSPYMPGYQVKLKVPPSTADPLAVADTVTCRIIETTLDVDAAGATMVTVAATEVA